MGKSQKILFQMIKNYKGGVSSRHEKLYKHIKNEEDWPSEWLSEKPSQDIDFQKYDAIFLTMGTQKSGGYEIDIDRIDDLGDKITIHVSEMKPPKGSINPQWLTLPLYIAIMPKASKPVEFETHYPIVPLVEEPKKWYQHR